MKIFNFFFFFLLFFFFIYFIIKFFLFLLLFVCSIYCIRKSFFSNSIPIYELTSLNITNWGYSGILNLKNGSCIFGKLISPLQIDVYFETKTRLHFKIYDPLNKRWE